MQKFRFLLPLFVLTLAVAGISYSVRSYQQQAPDQVAVNTEAEGTSEVMPNDNTGNETTTEVSPTKAPGLLSRLFGRGGSTSGNTATPSTSNTTPTVAPIKTSFSESTVEVPINQERTVSILLDSNVERPTAYTFNLSFDPKSVNVVKVETGDIWERANILTKSQDQINNTTGKVTFSAGQAFGTQKTSGTTLMKVTLMTKATAATGSELKIENTSSFGYVGLDYLVPLTAQSIQIQVKN